MKTRQLREKLKNGYLDIGGYFNEAFEFFKVVLKEEMSWIIGTFIFLIIREYLTIKYVNAVGLYGIGNVDGEDTYLMLFSIFYNLYQIFFLKRIIDKIDGKEKIATSKVIVKSIILFIAIFPICLILGFFLVFAQAGGIPIIIFLLLIGAVLYISYLLYFIQIYYTRDKGILATLQYSAHISKGNRLRILLPAVILFILSFAIGSVVGIAIGGFNLIPGISNIVSGVNIVITSLLTVIIVVFRYILMSMIFLNVEYMDLKKSDKENIIKDINEIDNISLETNNDTNNIIIENENITEIKETIDNKIEEVDNIISKENDIID